MQTAETILGIIQERGRRGLPLTRVYRLLFNPQLYLRAYARIYRNAGAMTPGITEETADGMSLQKIEAIIETVRYERYRWTPVRRVYIEKKHSTKKRPLGIPPWSDKLLQEVLRSILEAYYEPQFSPHAHGFRPQRGCHTALSEIQHTWMGTTWFIEGDITACFDRLDHSILLSLLREKIHDNRFLRLIEGLLKAGYLEDWTYHSTLSGSPQGGVISPSLSNIYLDKLDTYIETHLLPSYNRGDHRRKNRTYNTLSRRVQRLKKRGKIKEARQQRRLMQQFPSGDPDDPAYRRLYYCRYADDWLLGFAGPKQEAEEIKQKIKAFLHEHLALELSEVKTLITHAKTETARFLGYHIAVFQENRKLDHTRRRNINGGITLKVPQEVIQEKISPYQQGKKPRARSECCNDTVFSIIAQYQQTYRGIVEYYQFAHNCHQFGRLKWVMEQSLVRTLAQKLNTTVKKIYGRYKTSVPTDQGTTCVLQETIEREGKAPLVARWGGISLARKERDNLNDQPTQIWNGRSELLQRFLAQRCELCDSTEHIQVHHIRALKDLQKKGRAEKPAWVKRMAARHRKTLVVCQKCHTDIHNGHPTRNAIKA